MQLLIADTLGLLDPARAKCYQRTYEDWGYELGVGRSGIYEGHSHLHFCDLMYSPDGIESATHDGRVVRGRLVVVPARTYFAETRIGAFFFVKFCPRPGPIVVPDKVSTIVAEGNILSFDRSAEIELPWFPSASRARESLVVSLQDDHLRLEFGSNHTVEVFP